MLPFRRIRTACTAACFTLLLCDVLVSLPHYSVQAATGKNVAESDLNPTAFTNLVQLTEAVLAPAWGTGGYAYTTAGLYVKHTRSLRPVCLRTRTSPSAITAPFTFSLFDAQFSPLYGVTPGNTSASAIAQLDLQKWCYVSLTATDACIAAFESQDVQCLFGGEDALDINWTADVLTADTALATDEKFAHLTTSLPASGLSASELFATFLHDYLPQRAWLRTAVPRSLDTLYTAMEATRAFYNSSAALTDLDEIADMQRAVTSEWNSYLWNVYGPQLRRKWDLLYRLAVATLTKGGIAPSLDVNIMANVLEYSISGSSGPVCVTMCPLVDEWLPLRYSPDDLNAARLAQLMEAAVTDLGKSLAAMRGHLNDSSATDVGHSDNLLFQLIRSAYCVTTTNLFSITALLDRPFLRTISSVWVDVSNHSDSWAWQTMRTASVSVATNDAAAFQSSTTAQVRTMSRSLATATEKAFVDCLVTFLDPTTPLTSTAVVAPTDCVRQFLKTRDVSVSLAENFTVLFKLDKLSAVSSANSVPGVTRYESAVTMPVAGESTSEELKWFVVQESALPFTAQTSIFTPTPSSASPSDPCATTSQHLTLEKGWDWAYECAAGTYVMEGNATCVVCPSACAASASSLFKSTVPVYCPGDGLLHGCPFRPDDAVYAGSTSGGQSGPSGICRYTCSNVYTAPMNYSCLSVSGTYYNTSAMGNTDVYNGGGLSPCIGPSSLFPASAPVSSKAPLYIFVGSGTTNAPLTCPFALLHRATSSAVSLRALETTGVAPPPPFFKVDATSFSASAPTPPLFLRNGVTWEVEVQLNATQLHAMHATLRQFLRKQSGRCLSDDATTTSTIAHELFAWQNAPSDSSASSTGETDRALSWYLVSTVHHENRNSTSEVCSARGISATVSLQLLLNLSVTPPLFSPTATTASPLSPTGTVNTTTATSPAPASLVVLSSAWPWTPQSCNTASSPLSASTYRVVLHQQTNTVVFYVDGSTRPLSTTPVTVDWPLWASSASQAPAAETKASLNIHNSSTKPSASSSFFLSVGGWVAGYAESLQWHLATDSSTASDSIALPFYYDYLPGMVMRLSSAAAPIHPLQGILHSAEITWQVQASASAAAQGQHVAQLTSLKDLVHYVASTQTVASNVSAALNVLALRTRKGLDGMCRPSYGILPTPRLDSVCEVCMKGAYTVMNIAAAEKNRCACVPQRIRTVATEVSTNQPVSACRVRTNGPAAPQEELTAARTLYLDGDVVDSENVTAARIPLGWYAASAVGKADAVPAASLVASVLCTLGLTYPVTKATNFLPADEALFNTSVSLQYTTGLGGEMCETRAAVWGGASSASPPFTTVGAASTMSRPSYTSLRLYSTRLQAPALTPTAITLKNNSALFIDQTVLAVGVHNYALLSFYAMHSLLQLEHLTEYHLSFLVYVLRSVTVSAKLDCGGDARKEGATRDLTWANGSALDTSVLWLNLTEVIDRDCILTVRVTAAATATRESAVPFTSWPYSYLRVPPSIPPLSFFESSPPLVYVVRAPSKAFRVVQRHNILFELSSFLMVGCIAVLSLMLGFFYAISDHAPSLDLRPWRRFEREMARKLLEEDH